ncbi:hypothetical protein [Gryllotalpicola koreensis]|uniref:hypothetical protein n=1 Tax=Gryllotalpicola koreensis TaxID=993086 RepID=UPI0031E0C946
MGIQIAVASDDATAYAELSRSIEAILPALDADQRQVLTRAAMLIVAGLSEDVVGHTGERGYDVLERLLVEIATKEG